MKLITNKILFLTIGAFLLIGVSHDLASAALGRLTTPAKSSFTKKPSDSLTSFF